MNFEFQQLSKERRYSSNSNEFAIDIEEIDSPNLITRENKMLPSLSTISLLSLNMSNNNNNNNNKEKENNSYKENKERTSFNHQRHQIYKRCKENNINKENINKERENKERENNNKEKEKEINVNNKDNGYMSPILTPINDNNDNLPMTPLLLED